MKHLKIITVFIALVVLISSCNASDYHLYECRKVNGETGKIMASVPMAFEGQYKVGDTVFIDDFTINNFKGVKAVIIKEH